MGTKNKSISVIEGVLIQPSCDVCTPDQIKRLTSNVATTLAFRYLHPADEHDRENAFDGLVALCWKARGNLCLLPTWSEQAQGKTWLTCTHEFVEDFVLDYFERYQGQTEEQILAAALNDRFRYLGRRLWSRLRDEIGRRTALKNREPWRESLANAKHVSVEPDYQEMYHSKGSNPLEFVKARETSLKDSLGEKNYEVLIAAAETYPQAFEGTDQQSKSALTRAIQRRRSVSEQQARADKRDLTLKVSEEMRRGNPALNDVHELLARGDDDHTLRENFVSPDGRRKRSIRMRIEFSRKLSF